MTLGLPSWRSELEEQLGDVVRFDVPLASRVAFKIGGPADAFLRPTTSEQLATALSIADAHELGVTVLGTGSNVLVSDLGIRGLTIRLAGELADIVIEEPADGYAKMHVGAGALNAPVVAKALERGLVGVEFLATIPGTFGGALIMNAGAHGGEIGPYVESVELIDERRKVVLRAGDDCGFAYRQSGFSPGELITRSTLKVPLGSVEEARAHLGEMRKKRRATQPIREPNAGSIFKNPPGDYAGRLIEACGLKGRRFGNACISPLHANFIVNMGGATASDVKVLAAEAQSAVRKKFGVELEWEVKRLGE